MPASHMTTAPTVPDRKPRDDEIDVYGLTHPGKVRPDNQDHFLLCYLRKQLVVRLTSIPEVEHLVSDTERLASVAMVADGVGGGAKGGEASRVALEAVTQYVSRSMRCYYASSPTDDQEFFDALQEGARTCHEELLRRGQEDPDYRGNGNHAHLVPRCLAPLVPPSGRRQPLLSPSQWRADPDHARSDDGAGNGRSRSHERGRGGAYAAGAHAVELDRRAANRPQDHSLRHGLGPRSSPLQ